MLPAPTPKKRAPKPKPPASFKSHRCVLLAVDAGADAGWAIFMQGKLVDFGQVKGFDLDAVRTVVRALVQLSEITHLPLVMVMEKPATYRAGGKRSFDTMLGLGGSRGVWRAAWLSEGCNGRRIVNAAIATWRAAVVPGGVGKKREEVRRLEQAFARAFVFAELGPDKAKLVGPDSSPAVLIGKWASYAGETLARLPPSARAA